MPIKSALLSLMLSPVLAMPAGVQTEAPPALSAKQQKVADFAAYKKRLLALMAVYRHNVTTVPDIEQVLEERFAPSTAEIQPGWIRKATPGYRSLTFQNRIDLYYGGTVDKTIWSPTPYYYVTYYVNFTQDQDIRSMPPDGPAVDPATCLSYTEFKAAAAADRIVLKAPEHPEYNDHFLVGTLGKEIMVKGKIELLAAFKPPHYDPNKPMDMSEGCLISLSLN